MEQCAACRGSDPQDWLEIRLEHRTSDGWLPAETVFSGQLCAASHAYLRTIERTLWPADRISSRFDRCDFCSGSLAAEAWIVESQSPRERDMHHGSSQLRMCFRCVDLLRAALASTIPFNAAWHRLAATRGVSPRLAPELAEAEAMPLEDGPVCVPLASCLPPVAVRLDPALAVEAGPAEIQLAQRALGAYARRWLRAAPGAGSEMHRVAFDMPGTGNRYESCLARALCPCCGATSLFSRHVGRREVAEPEAMRDLARALREARTMAETAATHDELTGLLTRRAWLREAARGRYQTVAIFAIGGLRAVNWTLGYAAGDIILERVASIIESVMGHSALVGRYGGSEFAVAAPAPVQAVRPQVFEAVDVVEQADFARGSADPVRIRVAVGVTTVLAGRDGERAVRLENACREAEAALEGAQQPKADEAA